MPTIEITNLAMSSTDESSVVRTDQTDADSTIGTVENENGTSSNSTGSVSEQTTGSMASSRSGRVWMSSVPREAKGNPPATYNELLALNKRLIAIIERCDSRMQVMMDDAQSKRRGAQKRNGRRGKNVLLKNNGLGEYDIMVAVKLTEFVRTRLLPHTKFLKDGWHIYSETPGTLSQMCLAYLKDVMGTQENAFQYWNNCLVELLNYKYITAKSESGQGFKSRFVGEDLDCVLCAIIQYIMLTSKLIFT